MDRARRFDNSYSASATGGAARDFHFTTPPVTLALASTYRAALQNVAAQLCTGDVMEIPTMCCAELVNETPVKLNVGHRIVMEWALHEVQPKKLLLKYAPGDTIAGETFTRASTGYYINASGVLVAVGNNVKRDSHYIGGVRSTLLEDARTNEILWANDFSNAAWVKASVTVATGIADPAAGTNACTLTATAATANVTQTLAAGASVARTNSIWMRRRTGVGVIALSDPLNGANSTPTLTSTWQRFTIASAPGTARVLKITIFTSGDAIDVYNGQMEPGAFASSEIVTTTVAVTRAADSYSLPFTTPPQEMTVYAKFVEGGTALVGARLFHIGNAADGAPKFFLYATAGSYSVWHGNDTAALQRAVVANATLGNAYEEMPRLFGDGSVDLAQSLNGADPFGNNVGVQTGPLLPLASAWSGLLLWLNSVGSSGVGFTAIQSLKIVAGARSLTDMRAA